MPFYLAFYVSMQLWCIILHHDVEQPSEIWNKYGDIYMVKEAEKFNTGRMEILRVRRSTLEGFKKEVEFE